MSEVYLNNAPQMTAGVNYERKVKSAMEKIMDKVEQTSNPREIVRASLEVKKVFTTALSEGPQDKASQRRISDLFCTVRRNLGLALTQASVNKV